MAAPFYSGMVTVQPSAELLRGMFRLPEKPEILLWDFKKMWYNLHICPEILQSEKMAPLCPTPARDLVEMPEKEGWIWTDIS